MLASGLLLALFAQPTLPPTPTPTPTRDAPRLTTQGPIELDVAETWGRVIEAYARGPIHERVSVMVRSGGGAGAGGGAAGPAQRGDLVFRFEPSSAAGPARYAIEAGTVRVFAQAGYLVATDASEPGTFFRCDHGVPGQPGGPLTPSVLSDCFPPLPLPALAILSADAAPGAAVDLSPYQRGVTWQKAVAHDRPGRRVIEFTGRHAEGDVELVVDLATLRVQSLKGRVEPEGLAIELRVAALEPTDPANWEPSLEGRRLVGSVAELRDAAK